MLVNVVSSHPISIAECRYLTQFPNYFTVTGIGSKRSLCGTVSLCFASIINFEEAMYVNVLPMLTAPLPCEGSDVSGWDLPDHIVLADPEYYQKSDIDAIIGVEY